MLFPEFIDKMAANAGQSGHSMVAFIDSLRRSTWYSLHRAARSLVDLTGSDEFLATFLSLPMPKHYLIGDGSLASFPPPEALVEAGNPIHVIDHAGHGMMIDNPTGFAQALAAALAGASGA